MVAQFLRLSRPQTHTSPERYFRPGHPLTISYTDQNTKSLVSTVTCYDIIPEDQQIVVSQPSPRIYATHIGQLVEVTALAKPRGQWLRLGTRAWIHSLSNTYKLSGGQTIPVVTLRYETQLYKANLRLAYRLQPGLTYPARVACTGPDGSVIPQSDVHVKDISSSGIGLQFPKESTSSAFRDQLKHGHIVTLHIQLLDFEHKTAGQNFSADMQMEGEIRKFESLHHPNRISLGLQFNNMTTDQEHTIAAFINAAQRYELSNRTPH